jgi:hypothetical protein
MGMKIVIADLNKDGRNDIAVAGKAGLYLFYHAGYPHRGSQPNRLLLEETYPSWAPWAGGEGRKK